MHKKPFYSNVVYCLTIFILTFVSFFLIFSNSEDLADFFELKYYVVKNKKVVSLMPDEWRNFVALICFFNIAVTIIYEW